ncbi:UPF0725 protein At4g29550-like isoform X2 [Tripterygium wilfordii]|uniref:UPF0725 protein At4g29550-like isoform X2 n=1 Tax=Tripterygium wilfordii TaxID=458696 RepID=UPI0018F814C4|nr:UPF0725 protein At4g29550-like isoform X2 [Tripterygium wilfordii]XP_038706151.1 UPF0725 protein At4g29550-like isoform X2 [Tripterygium wilfordii]
MASLCKEGRESRLENQSPPDKRPRIESGDGGNNSVCEGGSNDKISEYDDDDDMEMPEDVYKEYARQVEESEGFEVDDFSQYSMFNMVTRLKISDHSRNLATPFAELAIKQFNEKENTNFVFVRLLILTSMVVRGVDLYITFEAKDADGQIKTFQALVLLAPGKEEDELKFCRLKPSHTKNQGTENEQVGKANPERGEKIGF